MRDDDCPCGHARPYSACCGPLHRGERTAATAEELMRSRYAAFSRGEVDYLLATWHPTQRRAQDRGSLVASCREVRWVGLRILETAAGGPEDETGLVAFEARYESGGSAGVMQERSRFQRLDGRWHYVEGEAGDRPAARAQGRNEPCACGSGKKFKRCCGA
ncbi:MAG: YchJ family protein [Candidatus Sericytochromatia bacterium]